MRDMYTIWGCGNGVLRTAQPHIRLTAGLFVGCTCLLLPLYSFFTAVLLLLTTVAWCGCAAIPVKLIYRCFIAGLVLFGPYLLLTPWITVDTSSKTRLAVTGGLAFRSMCVFFIAASTISTLPVSEMYQAFARLPVPRSVAVFIVQLINQTMLLLEETGRIIDVLRLRGASNVKGLRIVPAFPVVWMVRMLFRADRTAAAMTVRGYGVNRIPAVQKSTMSITDKLTAITAGCLFLIALALRFGLHL